MEKPLVSIILPCYNAAGTIARAVRGVLNQTYRPLELIVVNDGSTDDTGACLRALEREILASGVRYLCIAQENRGLGGAINRGLARVTGEYLAWVDADDELLPRSVALRAAFLETHPDFGSVTSDAFLVEEEHWQEPLGRLVHDPAGNSRQDQFLPMLLGKSVFCSGCHLIRTEVFRRVNGGMEIWPSRHGQNWQLLLPTYYGAKHGYLPRPLYRYRVDGPGMTAQLRKLDLSGKAALRREYVRIVRHTLERIRGMPGCERRRYLGLFCLHMADLNLDDAVYEGKGWDVLRCRILRKLCAVVVWILGGM